MEFFKKLLNGAFGEPELSPFDQMPAEDEVFPEGGIFVAPVLGDEFVPATGRLYLGPEFRSLVSEGQSVVCGQLLAEIECSQVILEVISTCSCIIESVLVNDGEVVQSEQPLFKVSQP
ncbi:MAG: acetyl-CoA carboxylase biotin carboxyl carrier protein subunit [Cellvibrionaceae bacterium]|nr:acetyl-CoA carboxylase biotin carboxyl carrier protein subunit [Cellvibrionaceae bacterium]